MLIIFISSFDEVSKQACKDFISFVEVSPTTSETAMAVLAEILKHQDMSIKQMRLLVFVLLNSMFGKIKVVQRHIRNYAPQAIYMNYRSHRLNLLLSAK